ncbi:MAG: NAD(P)/FAD-dependent oxidoreductase [Gemmatimonadales bacterium]|nr:NAD(P)/FAD-dependent oxidoreductase [Gemmatimonadales bacterium]
MAEKPRFVIVGAGLVGSMLAAMLGREGFEVEVLERRGDPRAGKMESGRSINLAISARGLNALSRLSLDDEILSLGVKLYRRAIHSPTGEISHQAYGVGGQAINSFSRGDLNRALAQAAGDAPGVTLRFGRRCLEIDPVVGKVTHVDAATGDDLRTSTGVVVGADGAFSVVRGVLQKREHQDYAQHFLAHGYKELFIPTRADGTPALELNAMHIWPRGRFMMMAMANTDGSFTVTLYLPMTGENGFDRLTTRDEVRGFFDRHFPDAVPLMPTLLDDFFANPTGAMVTVRTFPWQLGGRTLLIGDAAHAIVPFYGQGANAGFEDCLELIEQIRKSPNDLEAAFRRYQDIRKPNSEAIADLALANFNEMRDHVASPWFLVKKRLEKAIHRVLPGWFVPLYSMISFSLIPYAEARARAERQARVLQRVGLGIALAAVALIVWAVR